MKESDTPESVPDPEIHAGPDRDATLHLDPETRRAAVQATSRAAGSDALLGTRIGRYVVGELLGRGAMGRVYRARDTELERDIALKVLPSGIAYRADGRRAFLDEARAMARVDHPNVVRIHEAVEDAGHAALAMELVDGGTLADMVRLGEQVRSFEGRRPEVGDVRRCFGALAVPAATRSYSAWVASVGLQLADAIGALHEQGLLHRDVKSSNVFVDRSGRVRLGDFGIAVDPTSTAAAHSIGIGTPSYAPPEQLRELRDVDRRADVFGLGATLYELCALHTPATGSQTAIVEALESGRVAPLARAAPDVPADLANVIHRAIDPERERRYDSIGDFAADLRAFLEHRPVTARPPTVLRRARLALRRHEARVALAVAALFAVALTAVLVPQLRAAQRQALDAEVSAQVHRGLTWLAIPPLRQLGIEELARARRTDPDSPLPLAALALAWSELGHPDQARASLDAAPELLEGHIALRQLRDDGGRMHVRAQAEFEKLIDQQLDPLDRYVAGMVALEQAETSLNPDYFRTAERLLETALVDALHYADGHADYRTPGIFATTLAAARAATDPRGRLADATRTTLEAHPTAAIVPLRLAQVWLGVDPRRAQELAAEAGRRGAHAFAVRWTEALALQRIAADPPEAKDAAAVAATAGKDDSRTGPLREALRALQPLFESVPDGVATAGGVLGCRDHGWDQILDLYARVLSGIEHASADGRVRELRERAVALLEHDIAALATMETHRTESALDVDLRLRLASIAAALADWERCARVYDELVALAPDSPRVWMASGAFWAFRHDTAAKAFQSGRDGRSPEELIRVQALEARAREHLARSVALAPQHAHAIQNLALFHYRNGHYDAARELLPRVQGLHADLPDTATVLGILHVWCGDPRTAVEVLEPLLADGSDQSGRLELARALHEIGDHDRAIECAQEIVENARVTIRTAGRSLDAGHAQNRLARAQAIEARARAARADPQRDDLAVARRVVEEAETATRSRNGEILHAKGLVLLTSGDRQDAARAFERAIASFELALSHEARSGRRRLAEKMIATSGHMLEMCR